MILINNKTIALGLLSLLLLSSCASVLNQKTTKLSIIRNKESKLVINKDTIDLTSKNDKVRVLRSKEPLHVTVFNDSISKSIIIEPKNSLAYYTNILCNVGVGMLIEQKKDKRYTYPYTIYVDLNKQDSAYFTQIPLDKKYRKKNIVKITPFKLIGFYNSSIEISYERATNKSFSTQIMASYLLPTNLALEESGNIFHNYQGYRFALEEKYYFKKNAPQGNYISLELDYLKNKYYDRWGFGNKDYPETVYTETFGINKKTYSINIKYGQQYFIKRLSIDWYIGLGARYKDVQHFDRSNYDDNTVPPNHINIYYTANKPGQYWRISMPFNVRIGWTF